MSLTILEDGEDICAHQSDDVVVVHVGKVAVRRRRRLGDQEEKRLVGFSICFRVQLHEQHRNHRANQGKIAVPDWAISPKMSDEYYCVLHVQPLHVV